jgi:transmembrane 9 superfamily protein 2/4
MVILFMIFGCIAGFVSARVYKMNGGEAWKANVALTAVLFPGIILGELFGLNFFLIASHSSGAVPFGSMVAVLALWALISLPLSVIGSYFGFRKPRIEHPVRTNQIPRQIPDQPFYLRTIPSILMGGLLPFGAIFIELYFIMNSIWFHRIYYGLGKFIFLFTMACLVDDSGLINPPSPTSLAFHRFPFPCLLCVDSDLLGNHHSYVLLPLV